MNSIILYPHTFTKSNKLLTELLILFFYSRNHLNFSFYSHNLRNIYIYTNVESGR